MKKILFFGLIFVSLSLTAMTDMTATAASFSDVTEENEHYTAIEYLKEKGVLHGYPDGSFGPNNSINRAEAMKIIVNAFLVDKDESAAAFFPDVLSTDWFFPYVMGAKKDGIVAGYDDGTFKPLNQVNLAETLKMVILAGDVTLPENFTGNIFYDVDPSLWYAPYALYARDHNVVLPDENGNLNAQVSMTRADFAEVIYRMDNVLQNGGAVFPLHEEWPLFESTILPFQIKYDREWQVSEKDDTVLFYRLDQKNGQFTPDRFFPNSASVRFSLDRNAEGLSKADYFQRIRNSFTKGTFTEFKWEGRDSLEMVVADEKIVDWYVYLDGGYVMAIYTQYGEGPYGFTLKQQIKAMFTTLKWHDVVIGDVSYDELLSEIFGNILVAGKGIEMINKLPDQIIIETDAIGVGTGAVDYYYSSKLNYTFKYERASDTILDKREGQTSAF